MYLIGPFVLKTMTTIEDKNIPSRRGQCLILFITICDFDEEKYDDDDKDTRPVFLTRSAQASRVIERSRDFKILYWRVRFWRAHDKYLQRTSVNIRLLPLRGNKTGYSYNDNDYIVLFFLCMENANLSDLLSNAQWRHVGDQKMTFIWYFSLDSSLFVCFCCFCCSFLAGKREIREQVLFRALVFPPYLSFRMFLYL